MPRVATAAAAIFLVASAAAGCVGVTPSGPAGTDGTTTPSDTNVSSTDSTAATTDATGTAATPADDDPPYGTQFVSVSRYENQSIGETWPADERSTFENLSAGQQDAFLRALDAGQLEFGPDEPNPFDYHDDDRPRVVKYRGSWYYVRVAIV